MRHTTLVLLALLGSLAVPLAAADRYVAITGSDSTGDGSSGNPYRQIRKALQGIAAGGRVLVADGHYLGFDVDSLNGTSGSPITIKAQGSGAIIDVTTDRSDNRDSIYITFSSYIVIDGLRSFNANRAAVRIDQSPHVTVRNGVFGNNATWGIFTDFSDDLLLEYNECYGSVDQHGIYVGNSGDRPIVRGNRLHGNSGCGLHMNGDISQGGDGIISGALVEYNISYSNGAPHGGSCINCDGVQNSVFRGNLIYDAHASGISLYQIDGGGASTGNVVVANTIDMASDGRWSLNLQKEAAASGKFFDNILVNHNSSHGSLHIDGTAGLSGMQSDRNVFMTGSKAVTDDDDSTYLTLAQWQATGHDAHSLASTQASLFVNWSGGDYRLVTGSPAIDAGIASLFSVTAPTPDLLGVARPSGVAYDIGAYEVAAGGGTTTSGTTTSGTTTSGTTTSGTTTAGTTTSGTTTAGTTTGATTTSGTASTGGSTTSGTGSGGTTGPVSGGSGGGHSGCGLGSGLGLILALTAIGRRARRR